MRLCEQRYTVAPAVNDLRVLCESTSLSTARLGGAQDRQHEKRGEMRRQGMEKGVGGRRAYSSSSVELSPDPPDPSPSFESIGFLMTRFWTTGGGPVEVPSWGGAPRAEVLRAGAPATTAPPLGGRWSRMRDPHLWHTVAVTELRVPQVAQGFEPIFRISSSSRSQSSNVRKVGCRRHQSWNSVSESVRPSCREASCLNFCTTSSYCRRIFCW